MQQFCKLRIADNKPSKRAGASKSSVTTSTAAASAVLHGLLLTHIAQYLDVPSLTAATATNKAFEQALKNDVAWEHSTFHVCLQAVVEIADQYNPASIQQLRELIFCSGINGHAQGVEAAQTFMQRLTVMPELQTLHNVQKVSVEHLVHKLPAVKTLTIRDSHLTPELLTVLQQLPSMNLLFIEGNSKFELSDFKEALLGLVSHMHIHAEFTQNIIGLSINALLDLLNACQLLRSLTLIVDVMGLDNILQEDPMLLARPSKHTGLRVLTLQVFQPTDRMFEAQDNDEYSSDDKQAIFVSMTDNVVMHLLHWYCKVTLLRVNDALPGFDDDSMVAQYCRKHEIVFETKPRAVDRSNWTLNKPD